MTPITGHIELDEPGVMVELDDASARTHATLLLRDLAQVRALKQREADEEQELKNVTALKAANRRERREQQEDGIMDGLEVLFGQMTVIEGQKSVETLAGRVGTHLVGEAMKVTDAEPLAKWLEREGLGDLWKLGERPIEIDTKTLKIEMRRRLNDTGEVSAPGVDYTPAEDKFYATPDGN